jgi:hypothetical protein
MKVLLDECVPGRFGGSLVGHDCTTVPGASLAGTQNGELLSAAERLGFEIFVTIDQGIAFQQSLSDRKIAIVILHPKTSRLVDLLPLVPDCLAQMRFIDPGELRIIRP